MMMTTDLEEAIAAELPGAEILSSWTDDAGQDHAVVERRARRQIVHLDLGGELRVSHGDEYCDTCALRGEEWR